METIHNQPSRRFQSAVDGGLAVLDYRIAGDTMSLLHVEVPPESRGGGIAAQLTQTALDFAKAQGLRPIAVCPYVVAYMRRRRESVAARQP
jgi:hypothetical protein